MGTNIAQAIHRTERQNSAREYWAGVRRKELELANEGHIYVNGKVAKHHRKLEFDPDPARSDKVPPGFDTGTVYVKPTQLRIERGFGAAGRIDAALPRAAAQAMEQGMSEPATAKEIERYLSDLAERQEQARIAQQRKNAAILVREIEPEKPSAKATA